MIYPDAGKQGEGDEGVGNPSGEGASVWKGVWKEAIRRPDLSGVISWELEMDVVWMAQATEQILAEVCKPLFSVLTVRLLVHEEVLKRMYINRPVWTQRSRRV